MANAKVWLKRVEDWRKSGLSSIAFADGKSFTGGGLRHMAHRLRREAMPPPIRLARVVRAPGPAMPPTSGGVVLVLGAARIEVNPGASREVLSTVLEALAETSGK